MTLQRIGYWQADLFDDYPLPQEVEGELPGEVRRKLVRHLNSGALFEQYRGYSWCRCGCEGDNGSSELTDGVWVWPEGLAHYVQEHSCMLPPEILEHIGAQTSSSRSPAAIVERDGPVDESVWTRWAAQHRRPGVRRALEEARLVALSRVESLMEDAAADLAKQEGLGEEACLTAGCGRQVLRETVFCPRCLTERDRGRITLVAKTAAFGAFLRSAPWRLDV